MSEVKGNFGPMVVKSYDEVSSLIHGSVETILIGPAKYMGEEDPQQEIQSYVMLYNFDEESGKLEAVQYQLPEKDEKGEETNQGTTGTVFGGDVGDDDNIDSTEVVVEDGVSYHKVNLQQFSLSITQLALRQADEVLGGIGDLTVKIEDVSIFSIPKQQNDVRGKLVVYAAVPISKEQLKAITDSKEFDKDAFNRVGLMGVSVGDLILSFNLDKAINDFTDQLIQNHGMDPVSASITRFLVIQSVNQTVSKVTYGALRAAMIATQAQEGFEEATANAQAAQTALADAAS